jgi:3-hydroxybutyryl-CoA dehydrogenase
MNNVENKSINTVAVIGSGTMGAGIAQVSAQAGMQVIVYDIAAPALEKCKSSILANMQAAVEKGKLEKAALDSAFARISFSASFEDVKADLCIEAIVEKLAVKQELMKKLAAQNMPSCILASNTSSIPITQIAAGIENPSRIVGIHFFNPAHLMKLVEIIAGAETSADVIAASRAYVEKIGKTPVMAKDSPGFIVNRVARHYYVEGLKALEENVASLESIDTLMESSGFRMGPFRLMDLIGVDTNFSVTSSLYEQFQYDPKFRPSRIQKQKVDAGHNGKKSGKGFYKYN